MRQFLLILCYFSAYWSFAQTNIVAMEYFIDTDPGYGNATSVSISPSTTIDQNFTIPGGSISQGFHMLVIRAQNENSLWGVQESIPFYVTDSDPLAIVSIGAAEYFIDVDPGYGLANPISITSGSIIDENLTLTGTSLSPGFHSLVVRLQDENGAWGMQETRSLFVSNGDTNEIETITSVEYFLDIDPGVGNGTPISITSGTTFETDFIIPGSEIPTGFHSLVIRVKDSGDQWSVQEQKAFYVAANDPLVVSSVVAAEYYLDIDPGVGLGTPIVIASGTTFSNDFTIPSTEITTGFHSLVIRLQDETGQWSVQQAIAFFASSNNPLSITKVVSLEYFVDTDPGNGNGTIIEIVDAADFSIEASIATTSLPAGMHTLYIRALDERGVWSLTEGRAFVSDPFLSNSLNSGLISNITQVEYFIGDDPGVGAGTIREVVPPSDRIDINDTISTTSMIPGDYIIGARLIDENGIYGITDYATFSICDGAFPLFSMTETCIGSATYFTNLTTNQQIGDVYSWDFDGDGTEDNATVGDTNFTYTSGGSYTVNLTITNGTCITSYEMIVIANDLPIVQANATDTKICLGESITLTGSGALSYTWDNSVMDGMPFSPESTATYTVIGTDSNGCQNTDQIDIEVLDLPLVIAANDMFICEGAQVTLTGSGALSYIWDNSVVNGTAFSPSSSATYTVIGTDSNGCQNKDQIDIEVLDLPVVVANASDLSICLGEQVTLTASGALTYVWDNSVMDGVFFAPISTKTYTVKGKSSNGCENSISIEIVVNQLPVVTADVDLDDICIGEEIIFTGEGATSYTWNHGVVDGVSKGITDSGTFIVIGTDENGCENSDSIDINVRSAEKPIVTIVSDNGNFIVLKSNKDKNIQWYESGEIMDGETNQTIEVRRTYFFGGKYQVEFSENGCSTLSDLIDVLVLEIVDIPNADLQVWPNPVESILHVEMKDARTFTYSIYNISGKLIFNRQVVSTSHDSYCSIDVSELVGGIYILQLHDYEIIKFVKID